MQLPNLKQERGAVAAEFAVILPILVLLLFGIVQMGLSFQRQQAVHSAAREAARIASLPIPNAQAEGCARSADALSGTSFTAAPNCSYLATCDSGPDVVVEIRVTNTIEIPFFGTRTFDLVGVGDFRCE